MHILTVPDPIKLTRGETIPAGSYLLDDQNAAQLLVFARVGVMKPHPDEENRLTAPAGSRTLFMRAGGFGDLMFMTPVFRRHKELYPKAEIGVCCFEPYAAVLEGLPYVDKILPYPLPMSEAEQWDRWVSFENAVEENPRAREIHITDLFAEIAGVDMGKSDKRIDYRPKSAELVEAMNRFPFWPNRTRVGMQIRASALARTYPLGGIRKMAEILIEKNCEVLFLGQRGDVPPQSKPVNFLHDLTSLGLTFRQSAAVVNTCDVVIAPDSALLHVAGALGVPAVGMYGPFPRELRIKYAPSIWGFEGDEKVKWPCQPCFHHVNQARQDHFPEDCPTQQGGFCGVMACTDVTRVIQKTLQIARKHEPVPVS